MAVVLALLASLLWGGSDFLGGTLSRRAQAGAVVFVSQGSAFLVLVPVAAGLGGFTADLGYLPWAVGAGAFGVAGIVSFYAALARGTMGVVAPLTATAVVVPVTVGLASGESPHPLQFVGLATAFVGVVLAGGPDLRARSTAGGSLILAAVAAVMFGGAMVCLAKGSRHDVLMTLLTSRGATAALLLGASGLGVARLRLRLPGWALLGALLAVGGLDLAANAAYSEAVTRGLLSLVTVLASLYPAVTTLLARWVHGEKLRRVQAVGVIAAIAGVVLIGAGGGTG